MTNTESKIEWIVDQHVSTNHKYDGELPYSFHLRMVVQVYEQFKELLPSHYTLINSRKNVQLACWGHDLIEDTRVSYNDVKEKLNSSVADIIYAVTNEKGKNRKERANDKYYEGIRNQPGAVFVKLCDRIANVQYSKLMGSRMFEMYHRENDHFIHALGYTPTHELVTMFDYLENLFESK